MDKVTGYVTGVNGNLVAATFSGSVRKNEVGYVLVGDDRLKGEVIRVNGDTASMQIYEMTNGIQVGDKVELSGELMSVELGPGLLTQVFDGLQNPLPELAQQCGFFLQRGVYLDPIPNKDWEFTPLVKPGDHVTAGDAVGSVPEGLFTHLIMVPFGLKDQGWRVKSVREKGVYNVRDTVAVLENESGEEKELTMVFSWPVKQPIRCYEERLRPDETLVTKLRSIDTFLPVAKGGTFCVPGPFGAGKTVLQHMEAKNADVDIVIVAPCGERAGEVVEVLKEPDRMSTEEFTALYGEDASYGRYLYKNTQRRLLLWDMESGDYTVVADHNKDGYLMSVDPAQVYGMEHIYQCGDQLRLLNLESGESRTLLTMEGIIHYWGMDSKAFIITETEAGYRFWMADLQDGKPVELVGATGEHGIAMSPFQEGGSFFRALGDNGRCVISKEDFYAVRFENAVDVG